MLTKYRAPSSGRDGTLALKPNKQTSSPNPASLSHKLWFQFASCFWPSPKYISQSFLFSSPHLEKHRFARASILAGRQIQQAFKTLRREEVHLIEKFPLPALFKNSQDKWVFTYRTMGSIILQILCCFQGAKKIGHVPGQLIQPQKS